MAMYSVTELDHTLGLEMNKVYDLKETLISRDRFIEFLKRRIARRYDTHQGLQKEYQKVLETLAEKDQELKNYSGLHANQAKYIAELNEKLGSKTNIEETLTTSCTALLEKLDKANREIETLRELQKASNQVNIELIREKADLEISNRAQSSRLEDSKEQSNYWYQEFRKACKVMDDLNKIIETWKNE